MYAFPTHQSAECTNNNEKKNAIFCVQSRFANFRFKGGNPLNSSSSNMRSSISPFINDIPFDFLHSRSTALHMSISHSLFITFSLSLSLCLPLSFLSYYQIIFIHSLDTYLIQLFLARYLYNSQLFH